MPCCGQRRKAAATPLVARAGAPVAARSKESAVAPAVAKGPVGTPPRPPAATPRALRPPAPRTSLATASSSPVAPVTPRQSRPPLPDGPAILVRYLAGAPVRIVGAVTGRHYEFRPAAPTRLVAREDAIALLASPSFRPA